MAQKDVLCPCNRRSISDLFTVEENKEAAKQGWGLSHVFDLATDKWRAQIITLNPLWPHCEAASTHVINQARMGGALAQKALSLVVKSNSGK